jgi:hypothetical protein
LIPVIEIKPGVGLATVNRTFDRINLEDRHLMDGANSRELKAALAQTNARMFQKQF